MNISVTVFIYKKKMQNNQNKEEIVSLSVINDVKY